jgi:4'-phosphopantetheinyl transferase
MGQIKIINKHLTDLSWIKPATCDFKINNNIDVWKVCVSSNLVLVDSFLTLLTPDEVERANRFYQQKDHNRFIISRGILRHILGRYLNQEAAVIEFGLGKNKKPYVINSALLNLQFNLSHSGDAILLAVSDSAIGADVEFINHDFGFTGVLDDNFSVNEITYIKENESAERFFRIWTRKEALTKATAQGLDCDLRLLPGLDGIHIVDDGVIASNDDWVISSFNLNDSYTASIASNPFIKKITFIDLDVINNPPIF